MALDVEHVDFLVLENARLHRTDRYELVHLESSTAVLRRGQHFKVNIDFQGRKYDHATDLVRLHFSFGPQPNVIKGTKYIGSVLKTSNYVEDDFFQWEIRLVEDKGSSVSVEVRSSANAPIGEWTLRVETISQSSLTAEPKNYDYPQTIYLLFNPWLKEDGTFMEEKRLLDEYILSDVGKVWVGPYRNSRGREWVFGQFDAVVLPACMLVLSRSKIHPASRGDPIQVSRALSKMVNSNDESMQDMGILTGRWDGEYQDGTAPGAWTGSVPILEEYLNTGKEVKYGQCWVFAGVVTTICRAIGIPSRVVTNLVSAHDANSSLTVDRYFDENNEELDFDPNNDWYDKDSIWNYHVWNDAWMARPDLPRGYGGWQAIDATPQETSDGLYQCGPASLEAIKCGAVGFNYDVSFMLASVNADLMRWKEDAKSDLGYSKIDCNTYHIGRVIYTKAPFIFDPNGDKDCEDITLQYKAQEGTKAERLTLFNGISGTKRAKQFYMLPESSAQDIEFKMVDVERVKIGEPFSITVNIKNLTNQEKSVQAVLSAASVYYTGNKAHVIKKATGDFKIAAAAKEQLRLNVKPDEYLDKLVEYCHMKIYAIATVMDTKQTWADEDDFQIIKPPLDIKIKKELRVNQPTTVAFGFKNPLKKTLTYCKFNYQGPGLAKNKTLEYRDVGPEEVVRLEHRFTPIREGSQRLVATFTSKELVDITGVALVEVLE